MDISRQALFGRLNPTLFKAIESATAFCKLRGKLRIRVMDVSKEDLRRTLRRYKGIGWDQSPFFKRIYEEEYGQLGGEPYGCLVADYYFDHTPPDVELLGSLAKISAAAQPLAHGQGHAE